MLLQKHGLKKLIINFGLIGSVLFITSCSGNKFDEESFSPGNLARPVVSAINVNNGGAFYCSISGGCPLVINGKNFFKKSKVYVGNYPCLEPVTNADFTQVSCTVGPGQNGVYASSFYKPTFTVIRGSLGQAAGIDSLVSTAWNFAKTALWNECNFSKTEIETSKLSIKAMLEVSISVFEKLHSFHNAVFAKFHRSEERRVGKEC